MSIRDEHIRALLGAYIGVSLAYAGETRSDIEGSYRQIVEDAKERAALLHVRWSDDLVPEYVKDYLTWADEYEQG